MYRKVILIVIGVSLFSVVNLFNPILAARRITYIPPRNEEKSRPRSTQSGANRGCRQNLANKIILLVPDGHVPLTTSSRPVLFYWLKQPETTIAAKFTLAEIDGTEALVETPLLLKHSGINKIKLPQTVQLEVNKEYVWTITLVCNPKRPSENLEIQAPIKRVQLRFALKGQLADSVSSEERSQLYASNGIWYDTLALLENSQDWQDLLAQIGLENLIISHNNENLP